MKVNIYSYRVSLTLQENNFIFNFCRAVFEKLLFKVCLGYNTVWYRDNFGEIAVF